MVVLHAFLALLSGLATMAALIAIITVLLQKLTPGWVGETGKPKPGYIFVNLGFSFLAAAAGGYVTAWIAQHNPLIHVLALAITVLLLAGLSVLQQRGQQPVWYMLTLVGLTPLGVLAGGMIRLRVLGIL
ncbi:MAG TPA: hypothetical protein VK574_16650 [Terracidiphilus sp.]|nr:hypothetical protein [Terracidiphilus sp.]